MISLKAYNREIEQLIDNGMYDDAIAHSIHILTTYPKCIDTYRNLGKSLLEQKKYPEALDVFSRVLSALPDDFISHVGLSIIFEDQNNLDLAIWHMEQAFDVQPSNLAIQDELKRLFGRRDGEQPTKIRLTKGALVRMYARGELFQQAITEILTVLEEDPRRLDLEVILARMYYFSGSIDESESVCNRILDKIPFCFEANRILQQIHLNKKMPEAAATNMNRLVNLDPYYQFNTTPFSDQEVPENKILLEKLDYVPTKNPDTHIPEWLEEINLNTINQSNNSFTWLPDLDKHNEKSLENNSNPFSLDSQEIDKSVVNNSIQSDDEIPDWIKNAGWNSNTELDFDDNKQSSVFSTNDSQKSNIEFSSSDKTKVDDNIIVSSVTNEDLASLFSELKEGKMDNDNLAANGNEEKQFPPSDWMSQFSTSSESTSSNSSEQDFPDWLKNFQAEEPQITNASEDMPDWLRNLQTEVEPSSDSLESIQPLTPLEEPVLEETTFDNIFDEVEQPIETVVNHEIPTGDELQDDGWVSIDLSNAENQEIDSATAYQIEPAQKSSDDQIPDWVKSILITQDLPDQSTQNNDVNVDPINNQVEMPSSSDSIDSPDLVDITRHSDEDLSPSEDGIISQQTNDELLDWLRGLKNEEASQPLTESAAETIAENLEPVTASESEETLELASENPISLEPNNSFIDSDSEAVKSITLDEEPRDPFDAANSENISELQTKSEVGFSEYANEMAESVSDEEPVKEFKTSDLHFEPDLVSSQEVTLETIDNLFNNNQFEDLTSKVLEMTTQGLDVTPILVNLTSLASENEENFSYWQCLGDIYSKVNQLNDALLAYQKAEDILVKTISS